MKIQFYFKNTAGTDKVQLENYVTEEKLKSLTRLLQHGNFELANLDIRLECLSHHRSYRVHIDLKIARHLLVAKETSHSLTKAFDVALNKVITQMRKVENIRHDVDTPNM